MHGSSAGARFTIWSIALFLLLMLAGSFVLKVDRLVVAPGQWLASGRVVPVQLAEGGIIHQVHVDDGETVAAGDVLASLVRNDADADLTRAEAERRMIAANLDRIAVELGEPNGRSGESTSSSETKAVNQLLLSNQIAFDAQRASARAAVRQATLEAEAAQSRIAELRVRLAGVESDIQRFAVATSAGLLPKAEQRALEVERDALHQRMVAEEKTVAAAEARADAEDSRYLSTEADRRRDLEGERIGLISRLAEVEASIVRARSSASRHEVRAPQAGTVQDVSLAAGAFATPGSALLAIVPAQGRDLVECWVENADISRVTEGMQARVKFHSLDYQDFGIAPARVNLVSSAAGQIPSDAPRPDSYSELDQTMRARMGYRVVLEIDRATLPDRLKAARLVSGMAVSAEIVVGERRVIDYLLSPVTRMAQEAGREPN